jgi:hypothetical protein
MAPRPWKPAVELDGALERGELGYARALALEVAEERHRPLDLSLAARFLPLAAAQGEDYDAWAKRWLSRWLSEAERPSIETAAELAATLADLPAEPKALDGLLALL